MIVFWDIDDTIYDRCGAFSSACESFLGTPAMKSRAPAAGDPAHSPQAGGRTIYRFCDRRGDEVFKASQTGEISMEEMYVYRYCKGFADAGIRISPDEALLFQKITTGNPDGICLIKIIIKAAGFQLLSKGGIFLNGKRIK